MIVDALSAVFRGAATTVDPLHPKDPALAKLFGLGSRVSSGVTVDEHKVLGYPAVFRGVRILGNGVAKIRPLIYARTDKGKRRATEHPAYRLVTRKAHPLIRAATLRRTLLHHALLWGNAYAAIYRDQAGRVLEMVPLLPDRTSLVRIDGGEVMLDASRRSARGRLMYTTNIRGTQRNILPENVLHIRGLSFNGLDGVPVVEILKESLGLGMAAREFGSRFFGQGAVASGVVSMPGRLGEAAQEVFRKSIKEAHQGLGRAHLFMVLEDGAKFESMTVPPEHAQFLQTREFEIREVANIVGVQPHKLGDPSRKSYASLEQSNQEHIDDDLDPWFSEFEEEFTEAVLTEREKESDTHFVEFNRSALFRANLAARTAHYASGRQWGYYSPNDVRRFENQDDIGPQGDVYLVPRNMQPANEAIEGTDQ